jgi:hypothetical protein
MHHALALAPVRAESSGAQQGVSLWLQGGPLQELRSLVSACPTHIFLALHCATHNGRGLCEREAPIDLR